MCEKHMTEADHRREAVCLIGSVGYSSTSGELVCVRIRLLVMENFPAPSVPKWYYCNGYC